MRVSESHTDGNMTYKNETAVVWTFEKATRDNPNQQVLSMTIQRGRPKGTHRLSSMGAVWMEVDAVQDRGNW